ncbi:MAG: helix-turn-helix transcriptional regulator [Sphingomonas paucimobilis]
MEMDAVRAGVARLAAERGASLSELSRLLGRNPAYMQQFIERGSPRRLSEGDRATLARYLGVSEAALGGPESRELIAVPRIDAAASAGPGGLVEEDRGNGAMRIDAALLRQLRVRPGQASVIAVAGDSMLPTLADGDTILVDGGDRRGVSGAIHVVRHDGVLLVKRLARVPGGIELVSDNPAYPPITVTGTPDIVGRVVWLSRAL